MSWLNNDGLFVRMGLDETNPNVGGTYNTLGPLQISEVVIKAVDIQSATSTRIGSVEQVQGVQLPKGALIEKCELLIETAFTSSGTVGSATVVLGFIGDDFATEVDYDGITTTSFTGTVGGIATVKTVTTINRATTGAGAYLTGATGLASAGYLTVANSTHASNPLATGVMKLRVFWRMA